MKLLSKESDLQFEKLSSMEIFEKYVHRNEDGVLLYEDILSKSCYSLWLSSRATKLKFPEGTFKRTISSHLRKADGRCPFAEDVEASLLSKYRQFDSAGDRIDVFTFLESETHPPRQRKAQRRHEFAYPYGYHEKLKAKDGNIKPEPVTTLVKRKAERIAINPKNKIILQTDNLVELSKFLGTGLEFVDSVKRFSEEKKRNFNPSAVLFSIRELMCSSYYCSPEFILPKPSACKFNKNLPIFSCNIDRLSFFGADEFTKKSLPNLDHILDLQGSVCEYMIGAHFSRSKLVKNKQVWRRGTATMNGKKYVWIGFLQIISPDVTQLFFQVDTQNFVTDYPTQYPLV
eukprot:maker-scaffold_7-snap-gene-4.2-mRNA-1 protein AED:0.33 eAED:0.33 QI:71/0.8/0.66/1/0.8/0.66/6/0/343